MQSSNFKFTLNLQKTQSQIAIPITLGDTARTWRISFLDGAIPYEIADGCLAKLEIKRPTGTHIEEFCPIENNSEVKYSFSQNPNTATVEGLHDCQIILFDEEGNILGTPRFSMIVSNRVIDSDDINLSDEDKLIVESMITAEAFRQSSETERINAESARITSEAQREQNELARQTASAERTLAEENRDKRFAALQKDVNTAIDSLMSPTVTITPTDVGHKVTVTDIKGEHTFSIINGAQGHHGTNAYQYAVNGGYEGSEAQFAKDINPENIRADVTPVKGVDYFDGRDGADGTDGKDYQLTSADMTDIAQRVSNAVFVETPIFVEDVEQMADTSKIYVLTSTGRMWAYKNVTVEKTVTDMVTDGFHDNTRLGSDGSNATDATVYAGYVTTPYIDLSKYPVPFTLHLEGAVFIPAATDSYTRMCTYTSDKAKIHCGNHTSATVDTFLNVSDSDVITDGDTATISFTRTPMTNNSTDMKYVRFSGKGTITAAKAYATYRSVVSGQQWFDTGLYYRPVLTNDEKTEIAKEAASLIDIQLLSVIGSGEVFV